MLINLRNALMASGAGLPYDAEVEFVESTGPQWINTGIDSNGIGLRADVVCEKTTSSTREAGVVGRLSLGDGFELYVASGRCGLWNGSDGRSVVSSVSIAQNTIYNISAEVSSSGASITINGTVNSASFTPASASADNIIIFNHRINYPFVGRIYSCKIYVNGVLVRDYIPVRKGTTGYLYDRVSGKLFGNAGTGDFVLGPDVVPVEYIESYGTEYIDTGYIPNQQTRWEFDYQFSTIGSGSNGMFQDNPTVRFNIGQGTDRFFNISYGANKALNIASDTLRHLFVMDIPNLQWRLDSSSGAFPGAVTNTLQNSLRIFCRNSTGGRAFNLHSGRCFASRMYQSDALSQRLLPVRVGTDATSWEGAMMDVLTRRIYRNKGTGAFSYGNDLKYPIPAE